MSEPTPPSLPPAMDPHQMNDTATPAPDEIWLQWHGSASPDDTEAVFEDAVTWSKEQVFVHDICFKRVAPLPTVAPHYAGLVERLEEDATVLRATKVKCWADGEPTVDWEPLVKNITDAISALTQLAPLAGEVERFQEWCYVTVGTDNFECLRVLLTNAMADKEKLAASERERDFERRCCSTMETKHGELLSEFTQMRQKLAAAKLDADALRQAAQNAWDVAYEHGIGYGLYSKSGKLMDHTALNDMGLILHTQRHERIAAHRATGGAGEKK